MAVNWALGLQQSNPGESFNNAFQQGIEVNKQRAAQNAMAALVQDPNNQAALSELARYNPQAAMQMRQQMQQQSMQQLEQHRDAIKVGAQIIRQINPQNQEGWNQALQMLGQMGYNPAQVGVPMQFDPQYAQSVIHLADALDPPKNPQLVPFTQGGGVAAYDPTSGGVKMLVQPNDGSHPAGAPASNLPRVTDQTSYDAVPPGGQYMDPNGQVRTKGGQAGQSSPAMFR